MVACVTNFIWFVKTCCFLHSAQEWETVRMTLSSRMPFWGVHISMFCRLTWYCFFSGCVLRWKSYLRSYFTPCHPEHTQSGNAAAHKDYEIVKESLAVCTRLICLVGFFIGLLSPVRALFLGIKYLNRNTCSLYHTCSQETRVLYLSELWIAPLIIFWFKAFKVKNCGRHHMFNMHMHSCNESKHCHTCRTLSCWQASEVGYSCIIDPVLVLLGGSSWQEIHTVSWSAF